MDTQDAIAKAAAQLSTSRLPVIAGLKTDVAGAIAALKLARRLGAIVDHAASDANLRDQAVLQDTGLMRISPAEARRLADTFLIVGDRPPQSWPDLADFLAVDARPESGRRATFVILCREPIAALRGDAHVTHMRCGSHELPGIIAALRARINDRPLAASFDPAEVDRVAALLKGAPFGVAIWSPDEFDALAIEMLTGLIKDLNEQTRWSGFPATADATVAGVAAASAWIAGLPPRAGFSRGEAEYDPWRFRAMRLVESGEADTVLWIGDDPPDWLKDTKAIVIAGEAALGTVTAQVGIAIGEPGIDHDAILQDRHTATLVQVKASAPTRKPSAADVLMQIAARLTPP